MGSQEILRFCLEKGLLVDKEILNLFSDADDTESAKLIIERIKNNTSQKIITKDLFEDKQQMNDLFSSLPEQNQKSLEKFKIKLGLNIEISKEVEIIKQPTNNFEVINDSGAVKIVSMAPINVTKKLEVKDFTTYFRNRFIVMRDVLMEQTSLTNLVSINKISGSKQGISLIGIVSDKKITKNKNILFEIEDLTGKIKVLVNHSNEDLCKKAEDIALDSVIGFRGSGNREIFFVSDVVFPDTVLSERKHSNVEEYALFMGDLHYGSSKFMEKNFLKFIDYVNGKVPDTPEVEKIKYIFIVGDLITGVGNYPNQEKDLLIHDLEEQFTMFAELLGKIRSDIKIIISPGNHDGVRLMEPQPFFDEKYAWPLYDMENVLITNNPARVNIGANSNFSGFNVLTYHGFSFPYYANNISKLMLGKAMNSPEEIMKYLLMNRHLAPSHTSIQYYPLEKDPHFIKDIPDIFVSGHTHKSAVVYHNNILVISSSSWEEKTLYQEKFGNEPDHCKIPMFNLKTRAIKILDFE